MLRTWTLALSLAAAACGPRAAAPPAPAVPGVQADARAPVAADDGSEALTLTTDDGVTLAASYWPGPAGSAECVIMLHQLSSTRAEWAPFVAALRGTVHLLTLDLRGHGGSTTAGTGTLAWRDFTSEDWAAVEFDVTAAARALDARGAAGERCVLFGSSIGSSAVLRWTMAHPTVPGLVLLSPGLKYRDLDTTAAARAFGGVALVARSHERGAEDAATYLERTWGDRVTMRLVDGEAHGVRMTEADAGLVDAAVALVARAYGR
jgi:pimeloyl-ACP methyl ester carboxylesterase